MTYCSRCGGILNDKQTIMRGDKEGEVMHYFCRWRQDQELKEKRDKEFEKQIEERRKFLQKP